MLDSIFLFLYWHIVFLYQGEIRKILNSYEYVESQKKGIVQYIESFQQ